MFQVEIKRVEEEQESIVLLSNINEIVHEKTDQYIAETDEAEKCELDRLAKVLRTKFSAEVEKVKAQTDIQIAQVKASMKELTQESKKQTTTIQETLELQCQVIESQRKSNEKMERILSKKLDQILALQASQSLTLPKKKHTRHSDSATTLEITLAQQHGTSTSSKKNPDQKTHVPTPMDTKKQAIKQTKQQRKF